MSQITYSSIPIWARPATPVGEPVSELLGRTYLIVGVGTAAAEPAHRWATIVPGEKLSFALTFDNVEEAAGALRHELARARVGVRVVIIAPRGAALALRGVATTAGLMDDEIHVTVAGVDAIEVFCSHCAAVTRTELGVDDIVGCAGCGRHLLIYHHVSRRSGRYLGFMVDAETASSPEGSSPEGSPS
ncbi:MAG: dimethylamine monooxygenase subunit DmmA family protein [Actinomycetota bacterium]|nr:dimethylamine monooxygenase subunit DmmA family protein [Actinomycetota bacterium]